LTLTGNAVTNATSYLWTGPNNFSQTGLVLERQNMTLAMAGTYTLYAIRTGGTGCDTSSVDIEVVVHPTFNETIQESICEGSVYTLNGVDYNASGTYVETFASINGCDSIVTLQLTVHPSYNNVQTITLCEGESYEIAGTVYTSSTTILETLQSEFGCDSLITTELIFNPVYTVNNPVEICSGGSYTINGNTYTEAGTYTDVMQTVSGCDSTVITEITIIDSYDITNNLAICEGESVTVGTNTYTTTGTYTDLLQSVSGCDSLITTVLTVNPVYSITNQITICEGESISVGSNTYLSSGTYTDVLQTISGCDSLIVTELLINPIYSINNPQTICSGGSYTINENTYTEAGTYTDVIQTLAGCDSTVITELNVIDSYDIANTLAICEGENVTVGTNTYTTSGTYTDLLQSVSGCDSLITTVLTVNPVYSITNQITICEGESISVGSNTYLSSGTYTDVLQTISGCDSLIVTELLVNPIYSINNPQTICSGGSYTINGNTYTEAGTYTDIMQTVSGCDSTVITELTVVNSFDITNTFAICEGESVTVGTNTYTTAGTYTDLLQSTLGCDSLVTTVLTVNPIHSVNSTVTICEGESISVGSNTYTVSGTYTDVLQSIFGCDSTVMTTLTVTPIQTVNNPQSICTGGSYTINGNTYTEAGTYTDVLQTLAGCDSTVITELTVVNSFDVTQNLSICEGESVTIGTSTYNTAGTYTDVLQSSLGCDSIVTTNLTGSSKFLCKQYGNNLSRGKYYGWNKYLHNIRNVHRYFPNDFWL
jgi:hypothetical protein